MQGQLVNENEYRTFWVNWQGGAVVAGLGPHVFRNILENVRQDSVSQHNWRVAHPCELKYYYNEVSFTGWEKPVHFQDIRVGPSAVARSTADAPTFTTTATYDQFNQPNVFYLSAQSFEVVLEAQSLADLQIAFLSKIDYVDGDQNAYEIVLNEHYERRHLYPRHAIRMGTGHYNHWSESNVSVPYLVAS